MAKKKRPPIEQLRQAGNIARDMLRARGIEAKTSILEEILATKGAPPLPGMPVYLPHLWTIKAAQQMMYDLLIMWKVECKDTPSRTDNITEFFKFVVFQLRLQEEEYNREIVAMPRLMKALKKIPVLKDVFSPIQKKETLQAMNRFFVDSFAVAVILKKNRSTAEYANWYLDWTQELQKLWIRPAKRSELKEV